MQPNGDPGGRRWRRRLLGHVEQLVEVYATVGELAEGPLLLLLHFGLRERESGLAGARRPCPGTQGPGCAPPGTTAR